MRNKRQSREPLAFYVWELPRKWIEALEAADYSHLPRLREGVRE
jgi:hypothetical protein